MSNLKYEEYLRNIFLNVNEWLKFAEAKNLAVFSLSLALLLGVNEYEPPKICSHLTYIKLGVMVIAFISLTACLISLFPILNFIVKKASLKGWLSRVFKFGDKKSIINIHYFGDLRTLTKDEFIKIFQEKVGSSEKFTGLEEDLVYQIIYNSRIAWAKYQFFRISALFFFFAISISFIVYIFLGIHNETAHC